MSLDSMDSDRADVDAADEIVALLQPFVDDELPDDERDLVAREIAANPDYQAIVREQQEVRAILRGFERELAPVGLRERIQADLDAVEAERRAASERGWFAPIVGRFKAFGRGAMLMVPAAAAAAVLFVVANNAGWLDTGPEIAGVHVDGGMANSLRMPKRDRDGSAGARQASPEQPASQDAVNPREPESDTAPDPSLPSGAELAENLGFAVQVAPPPSLPADVALVSDSEHAPGSSAMVRYRDGGGAVVVDRQRRAGVVPLRGVQQAFRAHDYYLARDQRGRPQLEFELGRVHHILVLEGGEARVDAATSVDEPDFRSLLVVADALRQVHGG